MITLPEILAFWLTDLVKLNIHTMEEHMKDAFHYENFDDNILALNFVK